MTIKELESLKKFIQSNNSFYSEVMSEKIPKPDNCLKFELILLYLKINQKYLKELNLDELLSLVESQNFILEEDYLLYESNPISLGFLLSTIDKIEEYKRKRNSSNKVITIMPRNQQPVDNDVKLYPGCKVISFNKSKRDIFFTMRERSLIYERTVIVDKETLPYINDVKHTFVELLEDMILKLINNEMKEYNLNYLKVLSSYLSLYPFTTYLQNKADVPYEKLSLPQNEIGLRKTTYQDESIRELERYIKQLDHHKLALLSKKNQLDENGVGSKELARIEKGIISTDKQGLNCIFQLYLIKTSPEIYNENLLRYIAYSFEQGTVEINKLFKNPIIRMFYIENGITKFYCAMHLSTLQSLIDPNQILNLMEEGKKLKKEVEV